MLSRTFNSDIDALHTLESVTQTSRIVNNHVNVLNALEERDNVFFGRISN